MAKPSTHLQLLLGTLTLLHRPKRRLRYYPSPVTCSMTSRDIQNDLASMYLSTIVGASDAHRTVFSRRCTRARSAASLFCGLRCGQGTLSHQWQDHIGASRKPSKLSSPIKPALIAEVRESVCFSDSLSASWIVYPVFHVFKLDYTLRRIRTITCSQGPGNAVR